MAFCGAQLSTCLKCVSEILVLSWKTPKTRREDEREGDGLRCYTASAQHAVRDLSSRGMVTFSFCLGADSVMRSYRFHMFLATH